MRKPAVSVYVYICPSLIKTSLSSENSLTDLDLNYSIILCNLGAIEIFLVGLAIGRLLTGLADLHQP